MNSQMKLTEIVSNAQHISSNVMTKNEFLQMESSSILQDRLNEFGAGRGILLEDCVEALTGIQAEKVRSFIQEYGISQLQKVAGALEINEEQRLKLLLLFEVSRGIGNKQRREVKKITSPEDAAAIFFPKLSYFETERFYAAFLNNRNILITMEMLATGSISEVAAPPALILKRGVCLGASSVILGHNHPSNSVSASKNDRNLTDRVKAALTLVNISLLDHIIISDSLHPESSIFGCSSKRKTISATILRVSLHPPVM